MKGKLLLILLAAIIALPSFAQKPAKEDKRKEMMEFKLKFLADEMELNADQKKKFNELYTQMETERRGIFKKIKEAEKVISNNKNASEKDYEKAYTEIQKGKDEMAKIEKNYDAKFSKFLSKKQIFKLKEAENKFMEKIRECRDKKKASHQKK